MYLFLDTSPFVEPSFPVSEEEGEEEDDYKFLMKNSMDHQGRRSRGHQLEQQIYSQLLRDLFSSSSRKKDSLKGKRNNSGIRLIRK